ncbi:MAG TPA: hypothetical protein DEA67_02545 [Selenomonas sp.]|nr:hypothetical protein [Selenomonas sp.]
MRSLSEYEKIYHSMPHDVEVDANDSDLPNVVFVLGESTSRNHMGIYDYDLPTTPKMSKRYANSELQRFTDVISPEPQTIPVVERLFTFYDNESEGKWYFYKNIFDILHAAGYRTVWLSNQEPSGIYGNVPHAYAERCSEYEFTTIEGSHIHQNGPDENILPLLDRHIQMPAEKNFYVLHLMGAHAQYTKRYPQAFSHFDADDENGKNEAQKQARAAYDNAVLYDDRILDQIIERFENEDAILIFVSDHGEDVYDDGEHIGHYPNGSLHQFEIPMLIWTSERFKNAHPDIQAKIDDAVHRSYMTDDMIHSLLDILNIKTPEFDRTRSIFNSDFREDRKRICDGRDYDTVR